MVIYVLAAGYDSSSYPLFSMAEERVLGLKGCRARVEFERHQGGLLSALGFGHRYSALICPPGIVPGGSLRVYNLDLSGISSGEAIQRITKILADCVVQASLQAVNGIHTT